MRSDGEPTWRCGLLGTGGSRLWLQCEFSHPDTHPGHPRWRPRPARPLRRPHGQVASLDLVRVTGQRLKASQNSSAVIASRLPRRAACRHRRARPASTPHATSGTLAAYDQRGSEPPFASFEIPLARAWSRTRPRTVVEGWRRGSRARCGGSSAERTWGSVGRVGCGGGSLA